MRFDTDWLFQIYRPGDVGEARSQSDNTADDYGTGGCEMNIAAIQSVVEVFDTDAGGEIFCDPCPFKRT